MRKLVLVFILALLASSTYAQKPTNAQSRQMNLLAIELMDRYEANSTLRNKQTKSRFLRMFESSDTEIFCDLYHNADCYCQQIPVANYVSFVEQSQSNIYKCQLSNIQKDRVRYVDGKWYYSLTFDREIVYSDSNEVLFPLGVDEDGNDARQIHKLAMTLVFDSNLEAAFIHSLTAQNTETPDRSQKAIIVKRCEAKYQKFEHAVTSDGQHLRYNSFDQALVSSHSFKHPDEDVLISTERICDQQAYELIKLNYSVMLLRLRLRNEIAPVMYSMVENPNLGKGGSFGYSIGADLGATFRLGKNLKGGFYVGAALTMSNFTARVKDIGDYAISFSNFKGQRVERSYSIDRVVQRAKFTDLAIPIYFNLESKLTKELGLVFDLGAKAYISLDRQCGNAIAEGRVDGKEFASAYIGETSISGAGFDASLFFSAGVDYMIVPRKLYIEGKLGYERGFGITRFSGDGALAQGENPVIYNGVTGEDLLVAPLVNDISIRKNALWISVGLKLKF